MDRLRSTKGFEKEEMEMKIAALLVGLVMVVFGIVSLVDPGVLLTVARRAASPAGLFVVAFGRLVIGAILYSAARFARTPTALRVLGAVLVLSGVVTPFFGSARARAIVDAWVASGPVPLRLYGAFIVAFGAFVAYTLSDSRRTAIRSERVAS